MTVQATFAATLVDEWVRSGIRDAVLSPGSRSSQLALALLAEDRLTVHVRLDERAGAFFALGCALGSGRPVVVVTTSGTAASELHPAVIEADLAGIPLIVCTADRPPELLTVGAAQAIDQEHLFGRSVRYFAAPGVPDAAMAGSWRSFASRLVAEARWGARGPGPVHANLAFREPFGGGADPLPPGHDNGRPWHEVVRPPSASVNAVDRLLTVTAGVERGCLLVGSGGPTANSAFGLARFLGWPVLAEPRAWPREPEVGLVAMADAVLRSAAAREHLRPEVTIHLGAPHTSRVVGQWVAETAAAGTRHLLIDPFGDFRDPERVATAVYPVDPTLLLEGAVHELARRGVKPRSSTTYSQHWQAADAAAREAVDGVLDAGEQLSEPGTARTVVATLPAGATLVVGASMPIRDVEWFAPLRKGAPAVLANRGASGIDGTVSTVLGVSAGIPGPVVGLLGDLAFLHDLSGLVFGVAEAVPDVTLVVVDNAGGGIFSFLPYTAEVAPDRFERAFATPQAVEIAAVARSLGCAVHEPEDRPGLVEAIARALEHPGIDVVVVRSDRRANVELHAELARRTSSAVEATLGLGNPQVAAR